MLAGRQDVAPMARYSKQFNAFSDDGVTFHGAYGYRWGYHFKMDQISIIRKRLTENREDRRCVLQMWDTYSDLDHNGKDVPCNLIATVQIDHNDRLDLTVFNRSNDAVWGLAGANAVHFSFLHEFLAVITGSSIGKYTHVTANLHGYQKTMAPLDSITEVGEDPYLEKMEHVPLPELDDLRSELFYVMEGADLGRFTSLATPWGKMAMCVLHANHIWRTSPKENRFAGAMAILDLAPNQKADWVVAQREWFERRAGR
jgi:hypothetical protein